MRSSLLKFIFILSLALNFSVAGTAAYFYYQQSGYWMSPFGKKLKKDRFLFEELSLRPEQLKEMKDKAILFRAEIDSRRYKIIEHRKELIKLMRSDKPDVNKINALISTISIKQEEMQKMIIPHIIEEKVLLDKKQQHEFLDLIENTMTQGGFAGCPQAEHN